MGKISKKELSESLKLEIENAGAEIVNDFSGGTDKAASAELAKTLNTNQQTTSSKLAQLTNPNLLINGDFKIWQRGNIFNLDPNLWLYTADRWSFTGGIGSQVTKVANGIKVDVVSYTNFRYLFENNDYEKLQGKTVTLSICIDGVVTKQTFEVTQNSIIKGMSKSTQIINWVKLELGSISTPFHPKSYAEELASCQRYYVPLVFGNVTQIETDRIYFTCFLPSQLRTSPTIGISTVNNINGGVPQTGFVSSAFNIFATGFTILSTKTAHGLTNPVIRVEGIDAEIY